MGRPLLVCVTTIFPWPPDSGGAMRVHGLLRALAGAHRVRLLVPASAEHGPAGAAALQAETGVEVETFALPQPARHGGAAVALWLRSVVKRVPPWILGNVDPALVRRVRELAAGAGAVVVLDDFAGVYLLGGSDRIRVPAIVDKHAVSARPIDPVAQGACPPAGRRGGPGERLGHWLITSFERRYLARADAIVVTSAEEGAWLRSLYGRDADAIVPSAVDPPDRQPEPGRGPEPAPQHAPAPGRVGWISSLDAPENLEGLQRFVRDGWPSLAAAGHRLQVAGRNPPVGFDGFASVPGVSFEGYAASLPDFLGSLDVAVVPLWQGRGVKLKTLTLMAAGLPVVATPTALEGLDVVHGCHCMVGDTPEALAGHLQAVLADPDLARRLGAEARRLVRERYTWDAVGPQFVGVVDRALAVKAVR